MMNYKGIYSFNIVDAIAEGKVVGMVDKKRQECCSVNDMTVEEFAEALKIRKTEKNAL